MGIDIAGSTIAKNASTASRSIRWSSIPPVKALTVIPGYSGYKSGSTYYSAPSGWEIHSAHWQYGLTRRTACSPVRSLASTRWATTASMAAWQFRLATTPTATPVRQERRALILRALESIDQHLLECGGISALFRARPATRWRCSSIARPRRQGLTPSRRMGCTRTSTVRVVQAGGVIMGFDIAGSLEVSLSPRSGTTLAMAGLRWT